MEYFAKSDIGRVREKNEDSFYMGEIKIGNITSNIFIVADGMGGHKKGEVASSMSIAKVIDYLSNTEKIPFVNDDEVIKFIENAISEANHKVFKKSSTDLNYYGMGTTFVMALIIEDKVYVANVGDSRMYLKSKTGFYQITRDNSYVQELLERGEITKSQAKTHIDRNKITRAIGSEEKIKVDFYIRELEKKDKLLLCSDGLTNMIADDEIEKILKDNDDVEKICNYLIEKANKNGGFDNITSIVVIY